MKHLGLVLLLCGAAVFAVAPNPAKAFEVEGKNASLDGASQFSDPDESILKQEFKGSSLAMPFIGKDDTSEHISGYGNSIAIPAPGVDMPAPAWALSPNYRGNNGFLNFGN